MFATVQWFNDLSRYFNSSGGLSGSNPAAILESELGKLFDSLRGTVLPPWWVGVVWKRVDFLTRSYQMTSRTPKTCWASIRP